MNTFTANTIIYKENLALTGKAVAIFNYLVFRSNKETGTCYPGLKTMARECKFSLSSVRRALEELLAAGLITKKPNYRADGSQTSNIYKIVMEVSDRAEAKIENCRQKINNMKKIHDAKKEKQKQQNFDELFRYMADNKKQNNIINTKIFSKVNLRNLKRLLFTNLNRGAVQIEHPSN